MHRPLSPLSGHPSCQSASSLAGCLFFPYIKPLTSRIREIISAVEAATALFPLAMAFPLSFWKPDLLLWKMLHLSHLNSFSLVIVFYSSFFPNHDSPQTIRVLLEERSCILQEQLSVSRDEFPARNQGRPNARLQPEPGEREEGWGLEQRVRKTVPP